jgi:hypothetical protein
MVPGDSSAATRSRALAGCVRGDRGRRVRAPGGWRAGSRHRSAARPRRGRARASGSARSWPPAAPARRSSASLSVGPDDLEVSEARGAIRDLVRDWTCIGSSSPPRQRTDGTVALIRYRQGGRCACQRSAADLRGRGLGVEFDDVDGMTMLGIRRFRTLASSRLLKRAFDLVCHDVRNAAGRPVMGDPRWPSALTPRAGHLPPGSRGARRQALLDLASSARWWVTPKRARTSCGRATRPARGCSRITDDPRVTRVGTIPAAHLARRASAGLQRHPWRDEPRRPAPARRATRTPGARPRSQRLHLTPG